MYNPEETEERKMKKIVALALTTTLSLGLSVIGTSASEVKELDSVYVECGTIETEFANFTFEDEKQYFKKDLTKEELKKAEELFNKALEAEKKEDYKAADKIWESIYAMNLYGDTYDIEIAGEINFEDEKQYFRKIFTKTELEKAKELFEKINEAEKKQDFDTSSKLWDQVFAMNLYGDTYEFNFADEKEYFKKNLTADELKKAEDLFTKLVAAEKNADEKSMNEIWKAIDKMNLYADGTMEIAIWTFADEKKEFKKDVTEKQLKEAEELFNKAMEAEKKADYEEANKYWEIYNEMDLYKDFEIDFATEKEFFRKGITSKELEKAEDSF